MGGQAFKHPGPNGEPSIETPRLPAEVYKSMKEEITKVLSGFYDRVVTPREAPGKTDYGDIDFLVGHPLHDFCIFDLTIALNAQRFLDRGGLFSLAVPLPAASFKTGCGQIDIHPCPDRLDWLAFMHSYADLLQIIGVANRPCGFTATDRALHVRLQQIEANDWKASMLWLSDDPHQVMRFLSLDVAVYEAGFDTEEQVFEWLRQCRLFTQAAFDYKRENHNDRRHLARGMFRRFIEDAVPTLGPGEPIDRDELLRKAITFFGKTNEYQAKLDQIHGEEHEAIVWRSLSDLLASKELSKDNFNLVVRSFKRWIMFANETPSVREVPEMGESRQARFALMLNDAKTEIRPEMADWIMHNWEHIKSLERQRVKDAKAAREAQVTSPDTIGTSIEE